MNNVLVTGGAGYIGSHTLVSLCEAGYTPIVVDNLCNSDIESIKNVESIIGRSIAFYDIDLRNEDDLFDIFVKYDTDELEKIQAVIHFAGLKAVGESVEFPLKYYDNNIISTLSLLSVMQSFDVKKFVFSSSATVYGVPEIVPINEGSKRSATNPYGRTKLMIEDICYDLVEQKSNEGWQIALLRYFNPIGAHPSGLIGDNPKGIPNNLMPYLLSVATGKIDEMKIFGGDYDTKDGTGRRDYVHVMDLARGHVSALDWLFTKSDDESMCESFNLGTGVSVSVLELINTFMKETGVNIKYSITRRRMGDIDECYADINKSKNVLDWKSELSLTDMIKDSWNWASKLKL